MAKGLMDRLMGNPAAKDLDSIAAGLPAVYQPVDDQIKKTIAAWREWDERRLQNPAEHAYSGAPSEVDDRILKLKQSRAAAGKRYYAEHEGTLDALIDAAFREASAAFQAAAEKMDAFRELERRHRVFQHSCGRSVSEPIADGAISLNSWRMWNYPANRRLHPPAPRTFSRPGDDPLVLG